MLTSWVPGADGSGFPAEHLPYGVFSPAGPATMGAARVGARIGDHVLDLARLAEEGLVEGPFAAGSLNPFMAEGPERWRAVRERLTELVCDPAARDQVQPSLLPLSEVVSLLPFEVADYVDFYSCLEHATNMGRMVRSDSDPLFPNWRHLPVGYHGRAGTVVVSGSPVRRPYGQRREGPDTPVWAPSAWLDLELEVGFVVGTSSEPGEPVPIATAAQHVFGVVLLNDWSARDIQGWEYQPLGPFLSKSFATSIAAWVTPLDALRSCQVEGPTQDPRPQDYLVRDEPWGLALDLSIGLCPRGASIAQTLSSPSFVGMYWQFPQQIAHLTSNGAHLRTGDLLGSGTVSGPERGTEGCLIELTWMGTEPLAAAGQQRTFLEDGDEVVLSGSAVVDPGVVISLGEVRGEVLPAS